MQYTTTCIYCFHFSS